MADARSSQPRDVLIETIRIIISLLKRDQRQEQTHSDKDIFNRMIEESKDADEDAEEQQRSKKHLDLKTLWLANMTSDKDQYMSLLTELIDADICYVTQLNLSENKDWFNDEDAVDLISEYIRKQRCL